LSTTRGSFPLAAHSRTYSISSGVIVAPVPGWRVRCMAECEVIAHQETELTGDRTCIDCFLCARVAIF
jgi:hypothetical protein